MPGRSQLLIQAFQASNNASSANPGNSGQRTGTQRLLACWMTGGNAALSAGKVAAGTPSTGAAGAATAGAGSGPRGWLRGGPPTQPDNIPTIATPDSPRAIRHRSRFMGLILLEALGAGVLLVLIVWWTMFSGRVKGELPDAKTPKQQAADRDP